MQIDASIIYNSFLLHMDMQVYIHAIHIAVETCHSNSGQFRVYYRHVHVNLKHNITYDEIVPVI